MLTDLLWNVLQTVLFFLYVLEKHAERCRIVFKSIGNFENCYKTFGAEELFQVIFKHPVYDLGGSIL